MVDQQPTNPVDGEQVVEVLVLPPDQAIDYLDAKADGGAMGSQVRLAQAMGLV